MSLRINARAETIAVAVYALLVICMWAWYGLHSGLGYETGFPVESESGTRGRHFGDNMRRFTTFFYHHAYVVGAKLGYAGSYVPYQLTYALLWLLRGLLVFQIVRMLGDRQGTVAFLAGAFTILHAADRSLNWVGQLNQFGFIFWMLLAFVVLLKAFELERRLWMAIPVAIVATQLARICIYSYESPLPLIFAFPVVVLVLFLVWSWRKLLLLTIFYSLPLVYCWRWVQSKLDRSIEDTYQFTVLREDWGVLAILGDWLRNIWHSLAFWQWPRGMPATADAEFALVVTACAIAAAVSFVLALRCLRPTDEPLSASANGSLLQVKLLALGLALVCLSFPAYLLLDTATSDWRTQLLSGPGAGIALASVVVLLARRLRRGQWVAAGLSGVIAATSVAASQWSAYGHRQDWEQYRELVAAVLALAPRVSDGTVVVLVNRRTQPIMFGDNVWWDYAVRLAYPAREVTGVLYDSPGKTAPGVETSFEDAYLFVHSRLPVLIEFARLDRVVVLEALPDGRVELTDSLSAWMKIAQQHLHWYQPRKRILPTPPDPRAVRRFGPIERE
jgi:hypothetical protein